MEQRVSVRLMPDDLRRLETIGEQLRAEGLAAFPSRSDTIRAAIRGYGRAVEGTDKATDKQAA